MKDNGTFVPKFFYTHMTLPFTIFRFLCKYEKLLLLKLFYFF